MERPRRSFVASIISIALAVSTALAGASEGPDPVGFEPTPERLPFPIKAASVAWADGQGLLFGGSDENGLSDAIVRHDPQTHTAEQMQARMPTPRDAKSTWSGGHAYIIGGSNGFTIYSDILEYDPGADAIRQVAATLPSPTYLMGAVATDGYIFLFGGLTPTHTSDMILRFDPTSETIQVMETRLPRPTVAIEAVWTGEYVLLFGGTERHPDAFYPRDKILRYDPWEDELVTLTPELPSPQTSLTGGWDGKRALLLGRSEDGGGNPLFIFDPEKGTVVESFLPYPFPRWSPALVWDGDGDAWVYGGAANSGADPIDEILVYSPPNQMPVADFTVSRSSPGRVSVDAGPSIDPDGTIIGYTWEWGDGSRTGDGPKAEHTYADTGSYDITLTIMDDRGGRGETTRRVDLMTPETGPGEDGGSGGGNSESPSWNSPPAAAFEAHSEYLLVHVDASNSTDSDGAVIAFAWDWDDGNTTQGAPTVTHAYAHPGRYRISLTVNDNKGAQAKADREVVVQEPPPPPKPPVAVVNVTVDGLIVHADGTGSFDPDGTVLLHRWVGGPRHMNANGPQVRLVYPAYGTYNLTLTIEDNDGLQNSTTLAVRLLPVPTPDAVTASPADHEPATARPQTSDNPISGLSAAVLVSLVMAGAALAVKRR